MRALVTGGTGFLGSHIAERLVQRGDSVRALVRVTSDTSFLEGLDVELVRGDVTDAPSLGPAMEGVDVVYHAAAMVSDWGPWEAFRSVTINGTRNMLKAAAAAGVPRFLHVSTDGVYRYGDLARGVTEGSPMETRFGWLDYYRRSKTAAEKIARRFNDRGRVPVTIVRPALLLGERDTSMTPGLIAFLKSKSAVYMGNGRNQLPYVYGGDVAAGCIAAATEGAAGEVYNVVSDEYVTQRDVFEALAEEAGVKAPTKTMPLRALYALAFGLEVRARAKGWEHRPELTRFVVNLIGLPYKEDGSRLMGLGWRPEVSLREGVRRAVEWSRSRRRQPVSG